MQRIHVIDSHTGGEPTRIIVQGGPDLGNGPLAERRRIFEENFDDIRRAVVDDSGDTTTADASSAASGRTSASTRVASSRGVRRR